MDVQAALGPAFVALRHRRALKSPLEPWGQRKTELREGFTRSQAIHRSLLLLPPPSDRRLGLETPSTTLRALPDEVDLYNPGGSGRCTVGYRTCGLLFILPQDLLPAANLSSTRKRIQMTTQLCLETGSVRWDCLHLSIGSFRFQYMELVPKRGVWFAAFRSACSVLGVRS
jgi:hypothetical protein